VRKVLVALVLAIVGVLVAATAAEAADLRASRTQQVRGKTVRYAGTTSCRSVVIASRPVGGRRALVREGQRVVGGGFRFVKKVRGNAAFRRHSVRVRCVRPASRRGELVGARRLRVVRRLPVSGGPPVLPQLLLGLGLLEAGGVMIAISRRPRFPKPSPRAARGSSRARRREVRVYAQ
jgi:hypothetical protein